MIGGLVSTELRVGAPKARAGATARIPRGKSTASSDPTVDRRRSELNGRLVIEAEVRVRPRSSRCAMAPHAAEVSIYRPDSRYHRLVFTVPEWDRFLADVKMGLYDVVTAP
jgi:hypothetical protein